MPSFVRKADVTLSCVDLAKTYATERGEIEAVKGIDLEVRAGEFTSIIGRSGSGKSSFLAMIGGLSRPSRGSVHIQDTDIWTLSDDRLADFRNHRIGFVYQFASLLPALRILDNVVLPARLDPAQGAETAYRRAKELLDQFGLFDYIYAYPSEISSGEQRRAVIARALINEPALLLADEPTSDLDEVTESEIVDWFRSLNRERGLTLIMVTHNLRLAEQTDRVIHISDGRLAA
jgi:ABC-type lipoprotein export system ATPase subunit